VNPTTVIVSLYIGGGEGDRGNSGGAVKGSSAHSPRGVYPNSIRAGRAVYGRRGLRVGGTMLAGKSAETQVFWAVLLDIGGILEEV